MTKETGGPVFPVPSIGTSIEGWLGLSIRDYFAAHAMRFKIASQSDDCIWDSPETISRLAYAQADAMIKERSE